MISDTQLFVINNVGGFLIFIAVIAFHFVEANLKPVATSNKGTEMGKTSVSKKKGIPKRKSN